MKTFRLRSASAVRKLTAAPSSRRVRILKSRLPTVWPFQRAQIAAGETNTKRLYTLLREHDESGSQIGARSFYFQRRVGGRVPCRAVGQFATQHLARDHPQIP